MEEQNYIDKSLNNLEFEESLVVDNSNLVLSKIASLYAEKLLSDVCLVVGGIEYPAHRIILCATSDVFQVMLMNPEWNESQLNRIILQETPACAVVFGEFLRYFYTGQMTIHSEMVMPMLSLADKYNIRDLEELCVKYMCNNIVYAAKHNQMLSWLQTTCSCAHYRISKTVLNFIKWNFDMITRTSDFQNFDAETMIFLLQQNDLVVESEMDLYNHVVQWLDYQKQKLSEDPDCDLEREMELLVEEVMCHIRFPMMSPRELAQLLIYPLTKKYKEFFVEKMGIGMSFHSGQHNRVEEVFRTEKGRFQFTPRLYTSYIWSCLVTMDNFRHRPQYSTSTLVFSSKASLADHSRDLVHDWIVDLSPKGICFKKCFLIVWQGTVEVPERVLRTVRLSLACKDPPFSVRVKIGILIYAKQGGIEHIYSVQHRCHQFSHANQVVNFDDLIPFDELNPFPVPSGLVPNNDTPFLVGPQNNVLKVHLVILPMNEFCCSESPCFPLK